MIEDCLKMLILRLCFCFLRLRLAVCGRVCRTCFWFYLCLTNRRPCLTLFMICAWKIDFRPRQYDFLSDTIIFDFQNKRNRCKYSKITHCLVTQVTQNTSRIWWTMRTPPCAPCSFLRVGFLVASSGLDLWGGGGGGQNPARAKAYYDYIIVR